jgi:hypothetical protein
VLERKLDGLYRTLDAGAEAARRSEKDASDHGSIVATPNGNRATPSGDAHPRAAR